MALLYSLQLWQNVVVVLLVCVCGVAVERHLTQSNEARSRGCKPSHRKVKVLDPIIGLDFVYERFFKGVAAASLDSSYQLFRQLGSTYVVSRWTAEVFHTSDPGNIKHILATQFHDFQIPKVRVNVLSNLLGLGIFTLDGQQWSHARAILRPALSKQKMKRLPDILRRHFDVFTQSSAPHTAQVDLQPLFFGLTMDIATEFLMGMSTNVLSGDSQDSKVANFVEDYMLCSVESARKMALGPLSFFRRDKAVEEAKHRVFTYVDEYIDRCLKHHADTESEDNLLVDLSKAVQDRKMLRDQVLHILLASRDTTASLLSNLFFVLSKNPEVYSKLRNEVIASIGYKEPTYEALKDVQYLKWCINESLRLHPVIASNAREATKNTILPVGGGADGNSPLFLKKGSIVLYYIYSMHRNPDIFGDRAEDFVPERWDGIRPGWSFLPFNGGPRICVGQQLALHEIYYIVAAIVQRFERMDSKDDREWIELDALAFTCKNGVHVSLEK